MVDGNVEIILPVVRIVTKKTCAPEINVQCRQCANANKKVQANCSLFGCETFAQFDSPYFTSDFLQRVIH